MNVTSSQHVFARLYTLRGVVLLLILIGFVTQTVCAQRQYVAHIGMVGVNKTRDWVILREMSIQAGDSVSVADLPEILERSRTNIYNLGLFNHVALTTQEVGQDLFVLITVNERFFFLGAPILKLEERNSFDALNALLNQDLRRLSYGLSFSWRNLTGRNETLTFLGQLGFSQQLGFEFIRPALWRSQNIDFNCYYLITRRPEVIIGTDLGEPYWARLHATPLQLAQRGYVAFRKRINLYQGFYLRLGYNHYQVSDSLYDFVQAGDSRWYLTNNQGIENYATWLWQYAADYRDVKAFPLKGWKAQVYMRGTGLKSMGSTAFVKGGFSFAQHLPLSHRWNFSYGSQQIVTLGDSVPFFEKSFVGLSANEFPNISTEIRGYEPYLLSGTYVGMVKTELKFAVIPRHIVRLENMPIEKLQHTSFGVYLSAFLDNGWVSDKSLSNYDTRFTNTWLRGYGVGLNVIGIYDLLIRMEYSRNHLGQGGLYFHSSLPIK